MNLNINSFQHDDTRAHAWKGLRLAVVAVLAMAVAACGSAQGKEAVASADATAIAEPVRIVATTTMLGDIVYNVAGDQATVQVLMPVGADPHDFQASSQQVGSMASTDLVVANGLGLEEGLVDVLAEVESDGARVVEVAPLVDPLPFGDEEACEPEDDHEHDGGDHQHEEDGEDRHEHEEGHDHDHHHGSCDPHIWMDPVRMAEAARLIAGELEQIAPGAGWGDRAESFAEELTEANDEIVEILSGVPAESRKMVTNHDAFGYFAELYDFEIVGLVIPSGSTLADPSSNELAELVDVIEEEDVKVIFTDSTAPSNIAEAVAADAGDIVVVELYTGSVGEPGSSADTLIGMLTVNAERIAESTS